MKKSAKIFIPVYIVILLLSFFYIKSVLKQSPLEEKQDKKEIQQPYPVLVTLKVNNGIVTLTYTAQLKNTNSVRSLLEEIRDHNNFSFEITEYFHKIEIDTVNKIKTPDGYRWIVLSDGIDITNEIGNTYLKMDGIYELKLIKQ
jgi:hypothetical protein